MRTLGMLLGVALAAGYLGYRTVVDRLDRIEGDLYTDVYEFEVDDNDGPGWPVCGKDYDA